MSEEYKITTGTISSEILKSIDIEPSIVIDGKSYTASEFNKAVEMLKQPTLNENQQIVFEWLKREHFDSYIKSVISNLYFYVNMTAIGDLENKEIQEMVNAYEKLSQEEFAQVLQAFASWVEQEEER